MHRTCGAECAIKFMEIDKAKKARKAHMADKIRLKPRAQWMKEAQMAFNAYIRKRDEHLPCISCGRHHQGQYHAGHYRSVGSCPELRFNELDVHKQCAPCNDHLSGNIVKYRPALIAKIGIEQVEWLEGNHEPRKYTIEDLQAIIQEYKRRVKEL